uniref:NADH dehydrogenase subunit 4L n=1 Tax=Leptomantella albella TaxID=627747 RepID=X5DCI2_LEPAB|nr:NADH dehydrogenase subunit 4L [Leptomantella albella]AHW52370.1 NADH dehydrogenase subunit 4L [Leptomantella albella]
MLMFFCFMFFCGMWVFCSKRKHLLMTLLSLEFIVLTLFIMLYFYVYRMSGSIMYYNIFFCLLLYVKVLWASLF